MKEPAGEEGALEKLRQKLYSAEGVVRPIARSLKDRVLTKARAWEKPETPPDTMKKKPKHQFSGAAIFFAGAVLFFVIAAAASVYLFLAGGRTVSTDNVIISVQGPTTIAAGDTVPLLITIENKNPVTLSATEFVVAFPEGTRSADAVTEPLSRFVDTVGDLEPGESASRTVRAVLFGEERQVLRIPITFEYRTPSSSAVFLKEKVYELVMTSSPLSVSVSSLSEISQGQPLSFSVLVRSNSTTPLSDVALAVEYPFGFTELEASERSTAPGVFPLGTIEPGEERRFTLSGTLSGQEGDERIFRFSGGQLAPSGRALSLAYSTREQGVVVASPFLATHLTLNDSADETVVVAPGASVSGALAWMNTLPAVVHDGEIRVEITGDALDRESVRTTGGFYASSESVILFNSETSQALGRLQPGDRGAASFSFRVKDVEDLGTLRNPSITMTVSVSGRRVSESQVPEQLASAVTRNVKIGSGINLTSDAVRTVGPFENTGPWPPTPDQETTYTIRWGAENTVNSVADGVVRATLPSYVRFTNLTSATAGSVTYSESTREVVWNMGALLPNAAASAAFQVAFLPSVSQRDAAPVLVEEQKLSAFDRFVQGSVMDSAPALTTQIPNDPAYQSSYGTVGGGE